MLVDLHNLVKPSLSIVDGIVGMEGNGPGTGPLRQLGILVAGEDSFSVDRVITEVLGADPQHVTTLERVKNGDYGITDLAEIEVAGETIDAVKILDFKFPPATFLPEGRVKFLSKLLKDGITHRPVISIEKCLSCKDCMKVCPMNCILEVNNGVEIDQNRCIQCHCCIEFCPEGAIDLVPGNYIKAFEAFKKGRKAVGKLFGR